MERKMKCKECGGIILSSYELTCNYSQDSYAYCVKCGKLVLATPLQEGGTITSDSSIIAKKLYDTNIISTTGEEYSTERRIQYPIANNSIPVGREGPKIEELLQALWNLEHGKHFAAYDDDPNSWPYIKVRDREALDHDVALLRKLIGKLTK
jgi:hypothetical protein